MIFFVISDLHNKFALKENYMLELLKKYKVLFLVIIIFSFQCSSSKSSDKTDSDSLQNLISQTYEQKSTLNTNESAQFKGKTVVFFSLNKEEYNSFLTRMGKVSKWEFDVIYNNFKRTAGNAAEPLKNINIRSTYTTEKILTFITADKDTLYFNRDNEDYFVGQIFFDGKDSLYIVEGLFKANNLEEMIIDFFDIKNDFNISSVAQISDSFRYFTPDTSAVISEDTIIPKL